MFYLALPRTCSLFLTPDHNMPVFRASMSAKEAFRLQDLVTLENEDYPDLVSVISVGMPIKSITKIDEPGYLPITSLSFSHRTPVFFLFCQFLLRFSMISLPRYSFHLLYFPSFSPIFQNLHLTNPFHFPNS